MENSNITGRKKNTPAEAAAADKGAATNPEGLSAKVSSIRSQENPDARPDAESLVSAGAAAPRGNQTVSRAAVLQPREQAAVAKPAAPPPNQQHAPGSDGAAKSTALHGAMTLKPGGRIVLGKDRHKASPDADGKEAASMGPPQMPQAQQTPQQPQQSHQFEPPHMSQQPQQPQAPQQPQMPPQQQAQSSAATPPHTPQQPQQSHQFEPSHMSQQPQQPQAQQPQGFQPYAAGAESADAPEAQDNTGAKGREPSAGEAVDAAGAVGQQETEGTPGASSQVGKAAMDAIAHAARQEAAMGGGQGEKERTMGPLRPSDVDFMPGLLRSLAVLLRLRGKVVSPQFLMSGLTGNKVTPQACLRAARKAGLSGRIVFRPDLDEIPSLVLPCILLLTHDRSCVVTSIRDGKAEVVFPETSEAARLSSLKTSSWITRDMLFSPQWRPRPTTGQNG